jgi:cell division septal protein FtsQ
LVVEVMSKTAVALAYAGEDNYFITSNHEVLKQPKGKWLDLPVITGTADSSILAEAGMMLQKMANIVHENSIAQLAVDSGTVELVPRAYQHVAKAHSDERLDGELKKLAAYYAAHTEEELKEIKRIDLRYKNQVVTTSR